MSQRLELQFQTRAWALSWLPQFSEYDSPCYGSNLAKLKHFLKPTIHMWLQIWVLKPAPRKLTCHASVSRDRVCFLQAILKQKYSGRVRMTMCHCVAKPYCTTQNACPKYALSIMLTGQDLYFGEGSRWAVLTCEEDKEEERRCRSGVPPL